MTVVVHRNTLNQKETSIYQAESIILLKETSRSGYFFPIPAFAAQTHNIKEHQPLLRLWEEILKINLPNRKLNMVI